MAFTSQLGLSTSVLGANLVLGADGDGAASADPSVARRPLVFVDGDIRQIDDNDTLLVAGISLPGEALLPELLEANETIYMDVLGSDTTGDGSITSPYKTLARVAEHFVPLVPGNFTVTVHVNPGVHTVPEKFEVVYPYGASLIFEGEIETLASPSLSNIDGSASTDASYAGLQYFDFDLDVTGTGAEEGHFVAISTATGGTRPELINGLHRIESVASNTATCRVWQDSGSAALLPSGAVTVTNVKLLKSVLKFTDQDHGVRLNGIASIGQWDNLVLEGNADAYANTRAAIDFFGGASIRSVHGLYMHEWGNAAIQSFGESVVYLQTGGISKIAVVGLRCTQSGFCRFTSGTINGCGSQGVALTTLSGLNLSSTKIHSVSGGAGVLCDSGSRCIASSMSVVYPGGSTDTAFVARDASTIIAESTTTTGYATAYSPTTPLANDFALVLTNDSVEGVQPAHTVNGYGGGANYVVTTTAAEVDEGTDSAIVLDVAGTYLISGWCELFYSGATYASSSTVTFKLRRTNNTAGDLTNGSVAHQTFTLTTFTGSMHLTIPAVEYTTENTDDRIALFVSVGTLPSAGNLQVVQSAINAEMIS